MSQWYDDRNNLADLWRWLEDQGEDPEPAYFLEKPWKWSPDFTQMCDQMRNELLAAQEPFEETGKDQWYDDRNNLADLWRWLEDQGDDSDPAYFLEKPWKWSLEFAQMRAPREDTVERLRSRLAKVEQERDRLRTREFNYLDEQKRLHAAVDGANGSTARAYAERDELRKRAERAEAALREIASCKSHHPGDCPDIAQKALASSGGCDRG